MSAPKTKNDNADVAGLVVRNIKKSFKQRHVLDDVSFHLGQGEGADVRAVGVAEENNGHLAV